MGWLALFPYYEARHLEVMDTMFFVGVNAGLLILLIFGLVSAKAKIKAGRKEINNESRVAPGDSLLISLQRST